MEATDSADSASQFVIEGQQTAVGPGRADVLIQVQSRRKKPVSQLEGSQIREVLSGLQESLCCVRS